jgi:hypothetical protein
LPQRREVLADGRPMELGGRAFDVLVVLIEANGTVVSKDEPISRVWPGRIVEENNLHAQIKILRKALSDRDLIRRAPRLSGCKSSLPGSTTEPACGCHRIGRFTRFDNTISPPSPVKGSVSAKAGATPPCIAFRASCCTSDSSVEILAHSVSFRWRSANNSFSEATHRGGNDG